MKKVFITGFTQSPYITLLYSELKKYDYEFYINNKDSISDIDQKIFKEIYLLNDLEWKNVFSIRALIKLPIVKILYFTMVKTIIDLNRPRNIYLYFKKHIYDYFLVKFIENDINADIIHIHSITSDLVGLLLYANRNIKIVCSYWGTDLLNTSDVYNDFIVLKVLKRADVITTESIQLKEILVAKYGRKLIDKIILNNFILEKRFIDLVDKISECVENDNILDELKINKSKKIIIVGNNGRRANNHIKILSSLLVLPQETKKNIVIILPLTYALTDDYKMELQEFSNKSDLEIKFLYEFLSWEKIVRLRILADIFIMMPVSDSFSTYFIESLYAGNKCIAASWLPYVAFKKARLNFWEVDDFEELHLIIKKVLVSKNNDIDNHRRIIRNTFYSEKVVEKWREIL